MDRIPFVVAIALLYSPASLVAAEVRVSEGLQYVPASNHEAGDNPTAWLGNNGLPTNENEPMDRSEIELEMGLGLGATPLFDSYGVFRTSINPDGSSYFVLGLILDEFTLDEGSRPGGSEDSGYSYGFGVSNPSFNIEYMMSMDEENYQISAIGLGFTSKF